MRRLLLLALAGGAAILAPRCVALALASDEAKIERRGGR
jgi:hypothetical protein